MYANMESGMNKVYQASYMLPTLLDKTIFFLLDAKYCCYLSGMKNYGQEKYEGVTQTWDVLQREVVSSQKSIQVAWFSNFVEA